jgi:hypothetical protein
VSGLELASRTERAAGAKLARQLGTQGVAGALAGAQTSAGIARISAALGKRRIPLSTLPSGSITAGPIDLVAALTR